MSSAICFNLDQSKILSSGNGLINNCKNFIIHILSFTAMSETDPHATCTDSTEGCPDCTNPDEKPYCHDSKCHCHAEFECTHSSNCTMCGNSVTPGTCDGTHCHGPMCSHL